jgi:hypothetical protein
MVVMFAMDDFSKLHQTEHMFKWLADQPFQAIRDQIESILQQQVSDSELKTLRITSEPQWLSGAKKLSADDSKVILVRAAMAFEFELTVETNGEIVELGGVFSWAAVDLDQPGQRLDRNWFDINGTLETFGSQGELKQRVYFA